MFLIESLVLSVMGGLIGTLVGLGASAIFAAVAGWPFTLAVYAIPLGVGVTTAVGIFLESIPHRRLPGSALPLRCTRAELLLRSAIRPEKTFALSKERANGLIPRDRICFRVEVLGLAK